MLNIIIATLALLLTAVPVANAQNGCCQLSESSCMGLVTRNYCEQELKGMFQEGVACRPDTGKCGVVADDDIPNSLLWALGGVFLCLLGFVVVIVFIAKRTRKSMNTRFRGHELLFVSTDYSSPGFNNKELFLIIYFSVLSVVKLLLY